MPPRAPISAPEGVLSVDPKVTAASQSTFSTGCGVTRPPGFSDSPTLVVTPCPHRWQLGYTATRDNRDVMINGVEVDDKVKFSDENVRKHIGESIRPVGSNCYSPDVCWRLRPRGQVKPSAWWPRQRLSAHRRAVRLAPQNLRTREVKGLLPLTRPNLLPQVSGSRAGDPIPTG